MSVHYGDFTDEQLADLRRAEEREKARGDWEHRMREEGTECVCGARIYRIANPLNELEMWVDAERGIFCYPEYGDGDTTHEPMERP